MRVEAWCEFLISNGKSCHFEGQGVKPKPQSSGEKSPCPNLFEFRLLKVFPSSEAARARKETTQCVAFPRGTLA